MLHLFTGLFFCIFEIGERVYRTMQCVSRYCSEISYFIPPEGDYNLQYYLTRPCSSTLLSCFLSLFKDVPKL